MRERQNGLRILHLTDSWGPGGAETVFADLASGLQAPGLISFAGVPRAKDWLYEEILRRGLKPLVFPSAGSFDVGHVRRVAGAVRERQIDVIQAHTFGTSVYASLVGWLTRTPVVCTLHGRVDLALSDRFRAIKWRMIRSGAARVVSVSDALRADLLAATPGLDARMVSVIYNGVDVDRFAPGQDVRLRHELGVADDEILIGAVGNVRRVKGYEVLVDAAGRLTELGLPYRIVIVGLPVMEVQNELVQRATSVGVPEGRISYLGFRTDTAELYRAFDISVLTSHSEGFPLTTLQALASGLPVVATRCGGPEEMVEDGVSGFLVERGSGDAVATALRTLINDEPLRERMGNAAREAAVTRFSTAAMVESYEALYRELCGRTRVRAQRLPAAAACKIQVGSSEAP